MKSENFVSSNQKCANGLRLPSKNEFVSAQNLDQNVCDHKSYAMQMSKPLRRSSKNQDSAQVVVVQDLEENHWYQDTHHVKVSKRLRRSFKNGVRYDQ